MRKLLLIIIFLILGSVVYLKVIKGPVPDFTKFTGGIGSVLYREPQALSDQEYREIYRSPDFNWDLDYLNTFVTALKKADQKSLPSSQSEFGRKAFVNLEQMVNRNRNESGEQQFEFFQTFTKLMDVYSQAAGIRLIRYDKELAFLWYLKAVTSEQLLAAMSAENGMIVDQSRLAPDIQELERKSLLNLDVEEMFGTAIFQLENRTLYRPESRRLMLVKLRPHLPFRSARINGIRRKINGLKREETDPQTLQLITDIVEEIHRRQQG